MSNFELRLKKLRERWMEIQALRDEGRTLTKQIEPIKKRIRQIGQELSIKMDEYNEVVK